ncbi:MAG TPA: hypothetical protein VII42_04200, partial [Caulobacteraceae bacterium]
MPPVRSLAVLLSLAALGACTTTAPPSVGLRASQPVEEPAVPASTFGLYLAGQAALDQGHGDEAAGFFARAAQQDTETTSIKIHAFVAALVAGNIPRAAQLAPGPDDGS